PGDKTIAYFSMEFGIHESIPFFAGGLGILAGDYLKASSDMSLPLVGVGLFYREGYFHQFLTQDGWQQEEYRETNIYNLPLEGARDDAGNEVFVTVAGPDGDIRARVWKLQVGRVPLYLLDTNLPDNPPHIRDITGRLYGGDQTTRLSQEVLLGIGGIRALEALNIFPAVCHMNEGHCAFLSIERTARIMERYHVDLKTALEIVPRSSVFTTHTPVRAGYDKFTNDLVRPCMAPFEKRLGISVDKILRWGTVPGADTDEPFSMFALGLRMSQYCNGVSELHGRVARRMWSHLWPQRPEDEVPIIHVTNGVHLLSWLSSENRLLFETTLGSDWHARLSNSDVVAKIDEIYDEELLRSHEMSRNRLIRYCRDRMIAQYR
ncbi:MAG: alpha-glucan family phosphorylase, partial [Syntrophaceae bacterium]|nr:alpha-glucan family phosphorylase [Syntrophaceae bacterium]